MVKHHLILTRLPRFRTSLHTVMLKSYKQEHKMATQIVGRFASLSPQSTRKLTSLKVLKEACLQQNHVTILISSMFPQLLQTVRQ